MQPQTITRTCAIPECQAPAKPYRGRGPYPKYCADHEWGHLTHEERLELHRARMLERERRAAAERVRRGTLIADLRAENRELRRRLAAIRALVDGHVEAAECAA